MGLSTVVFVDEAGNIVEDLTGLSGFRWEFYWCEQLGVVLDTWVAYQRSSKRHKFKSVDRWDRLDHRVSRLHCPAPTYEVRKVALDQLRAQIKFKVTT
jgi:hypothetical protein